jgi:predicted Zn-dependent protease
MVLRFRAYPFFLTFDSKAIDAKYATIQESMQRQNEIVKAEAEAKIRIAQAEGVARANEIQAKSITPSLLQLQAIQNQASAIQKWNGQLPSTMVEGDKGAMPFIQIK